MFWIFFSEIALTDGLENLRIRVTTVGLTNEFKSQLNLSLNGDNLLVHYMDDHLYIH